MQTAMSSYAFITARWRYFSDVGPRSPLTRSPSGLTMQMSSAVITR